MNRETPFLSVSRLSSAPTPEGKAARAEFVVGIALAVVALVPFIATQFANPPQAEPPSAWFRWMHTAWLLAGCASLSCFYLSWQSRSGFRILSEVDSVVWLAKLVNKLKFKPRNKL
jgi:hypothetical protein